MRKIMRKLAHMNGRQRTVMVTGTVLVTMMLIITGVLALAQYTGMLGEGKLTNPDKPKDGLIYAGKVYVQDVFEPTPDGIPFPSDGSPIKNPNKYPLALRVSLKEICTYWRGVLSDEASVPSNCKPILKSQADLDKQKALPHWKELPASKIIWDAALLGPRPNEFHFFYSTDELGRLSGWWIYRDIYDEANNWIGGNGGTLNDFGFHMRDNETMDSMWFKPESKIEYTYYSEDTGNQKMQWVTSTTAGNGDGIWESNSTWKVQRPTLAKLVKDWNDTVPLVILQTYARATQYDQEIYVKAADLTQTPTKNKWFYNEADGYFYYIGTLGYNESIPSPLDVANPVNADAYFNSGASVSIKPDLEPAFTKEFLFRAYGEAVEANKDAIATAWGLTFEPGSLGAKIFEGE